MKKTLTLIVAIAAAAALSACTPSDISSAETTAALPEGVAETQPESEMSLKDKPTVEYTIPADAPTGVDGGPGVMETTAVDDSYYPEDKRSSGETVAEASGGVHALYTVDDTGVYQVMADVSGTDADALIAAMVENGILAEGTTVEGFSQEGTTASISLNQLKPVYEKASEEQTLACVVNTLTENLNLESIDVKVGDKDYGQQTFTDDYDRT